MPIHPRQLLREATVARLTGATAAGSRVLDMQEVPYRGGLPAISVYVLTEDVDSEERTSPRELKRNPDLVIEGVVQVVSGVSVANTLDALALEIEGAIHADATIGGTVDDAILVRTDLGTQTDGEQKIGVVKLTYRVTYYTYADTYVPPDDFETADVRYNLSNTVHPDDEARDTFTTGE